VYGVIIENRSAAFEQGVLRLAIGSQLHSFVRQNNLGEVAVEVDHYLPSDKFNTRRPDVEFISKERLALFDPSDYVLLMPDLAVEVKSPSNTPEELRQKAAYYLQNGALMVRLVFPAEQIVMVYTTDNPGGKKFGKDDTLDGGHVLPGFKLPLKDIFRA
jgi:Uma2 family endonuclease